MELKRKDVEADRRYKLCAVDKVENIFLGEHDYKQYNSYHYVKRLWQSLRKIMLYFVLLNIVLISFNSPTVVTHIAKRSAGPATSAVADAGLASRGPLM